MKIELNYIFSIGYRCYSIDFLNTHNLRKFSGPFDYLYIDFETALKIINNRFENFLSDIVLLNKNKQDSKLLYKKNTSEINNNLYNLLINNIVYINQNYNNNNLLINQNYIDINILSNNLYHWNSICIFLHHDLLNENIYTSLVNRCNRFINIINSYSENTALIYITKIVNCNNIIDYINKIIEVKNIYKINTFIIIIVNCDQIENSRYFYEKEKCLFVIRNVESYEEQESKYGIDNSSDYINEFKIISEYFNFNIIEKNNI